MIERLKKLRGDRTRIILWTCRTGEALEEAVEWCKKQGLEFDEVNANIPEAVALFGAESRKIYANLYIDDNAASVRKFYKMVKINKI